MNVCGQFIFRTLPADRDCVRHNENIMKSIFLSNKSYGSKKANRKRGTDSQENGRILNSKPNTNDVYNIRFARLLKLEKEWMTTVGVNQKSCSETII